MRSNYGIGFCALALLLAATPAGGAQDAAKPKRVPTPEEVAEKASRKACKIELCDIFRNKRSAGPDIACDIVKTWREDDISKMVSGGAFAWPWGKAKCETKLALPRAELAKTVTQGSYELAVPRHTITCALDRKSEGKAYSVSVEMAPRVTFEKGKAVEGSMNWGEVDAPLLAYGVIWPAVSLDNKTNLLGGQLVKMTNEFLTSKCDEVKDELPGAKDAQ